MSAAAELREQIESALAGRIPAALSFRPRGSPELLSCGLAEVDALLGGGLPLGAITELTGAPSSGRTTLALATLAELTQQGQSCAYVDVCDALDPLSAAAQGVDLRRLLWVRPRSLAAPGFAPTLAGTSQPPALRSQTLDATARLDHGMRATDLLLSTGGFRALVLDLGDVPSEQARRIPLATWYRFRLQAEKSRTLFLLITCAQGCAAGCAPLGCTQGCAQSCAAVSLHFQPASADWRQATLHRDAPRLLAGLRCRLSLQRSRAVDSTPASATGGPSASATGGPSVGPYPPRKKPAAAPATEAAWSSTTQWAR